MSPGCYFPGGVESPTFPRVRLARPSLWLAISGISAPTGRVSGAGLCSPFFNFHFGGAETGSILCKAKSAFAWELADMVIAGWSRVWQD
jgi:hypothetical protein